MANLHRFVSLFVVLTIAVLVVARLPRPEEIERMLNEIPEASLHSALRQIVPAKYRHSIHTNDRLAISALQKDNAAIVTRLIELAKRDSNTSSSSVSMSSVSSSSSVPSSTTTSSSSAPSTTSSSASPSSTSSTPSTSTTSTTTPSSTTTTTPSSTPSSSRPASTPVTTSTALVVATSTSVVPGSTPTTTTTPVVSSTTTSTPTTKPSSTKNAATTIPTTETLISTSSLSTIIFQTTAANGDRSTVTQVTLVPAVVTGFVTPSGSIRATTTTGGSLQTGAAALKSYDILAQALVGGAFVGAFIL